MVNQKQKIIGLTGGIATGKSTVSQYLSMQYNLPIFDADIIAREAVAVNSPIWHNIIDRYQQQVVDDDGNLHRGNLAKIIFHDETEKKWLENQIHPFVYHSFQQIITDNKEALIVLVIPLLFEANMTDLVTDIWVVSCELTLEIDRLMRRNNLTYSEAQMRIKSQMPLGEKIQRADIILHNNADLNSLYSQIDSVMSSYFHKS